MHSKKETSLYTLYVRRRQLMTVIKKNLGFNYWKKYVIKQLLSEPNEVVFRITFGRTDRSAWVSPHILNWLAEPKDASKFPKNLQNHHPASSIVKHLIQSGHKIEPHTAFSFFCINCKGRLICFKETLPVKNFDSILCVQKQFMLTLPQLWYCGNKIIGLNE